MNVSEYETFHDDAQKTLVAAVDDNNQQKTNVVECARSFELVRQLISGVDLAIQSYHERFYYREGCHNEW